MGSFVNMSQSQPDDYRFAFNGKEKIDEAYGEGNAYDFGARIYDPRIGRWLATDPLAAKYPFVSPYQFVNNSPLILIDPNGKEWINAYDAEVESLNKQLLDNPNDKKLQKALVEATDNQAAVNQIIGELKTNDVALYNYIDKLQVEDARTGELINVKVTVGLGDRSERSSTENAQTKLNNQNDIPSSKKQYIKYNSMEGTGAAPAPLNSKNEVGFDVKIFNVNVFQIDDWHDNELADEAGDVMFAIEYPIASSESGSDADKNWTDYKKPGSAGDYSARVRITYTQREKDGSGKDPNNNPYPLKK